MFPGTLAFSRFDYPSALPESVQQRMSDIAATLMPALGFDNGMFNIEMMYDPEADAISIIEINPRMASQFADLYEKVDGTNSYAVLLDIAQGRTPRFTRRQGRYGFCLEHRASQFRGLFRRRSACARPILNDSTRIYPDIRIEILAHGSGACSLVGNAGWNELSLRHRQSRRPATATTCWRNSLPAATVSASCSSRSRHAATGAGVGGGESVQVGA